MKLNDLIPNSPKKNASVLDMAFLPARARQPAVEPKARIPHRRRRTPISAGRQPAILPPLAVRARKGFTPPYEIEFNEVNLDQLSSFKAEARVTPETLQEARLLRDPRNPVAILGRGNSRPPLKCVFTVSPRAPRPKLRRRRFGGIDRITLPARRPFMKNAFSGWRYLWKSQDIRRKLIITLIILVIFRLAANVPVPGINGAALKSLLSGSGSFFAFLDLLSGGTISHFSLLAMGVYPYITAQIILQLLIPIFPALQRRMEEDPREGRKWMEKWTYYLAVPMAALSAIGQINIFNSYSAQAGRARSCLLVLPVPCGSLH